MLFISLIASAVLLIAANRIVYRARNPVAKTIGLSLGLSFGPLVVMCLLPTLAIQGLLLGLTVITWRISGRGPATFLRLSCGATFAAYVIGTLMAWTGERESARLRGMYPYQSMEEMVPPPRPAFRDAPLVPAAVGRLEQLEAEIGEDSSASWYRNHQLELLHEHAVGLFVNSPGFGVTRMIRPSELGIKLGVRSSPVPLQPGPRTASGWSPGNLERPTADDQAFLAWMFEDSVQDFVFSRGWGYLRDRRHVAGFVPHRFSNVPGPTDHWKVHHGKSQFTRAPIPTTAWRVQTLDLIGLLIHDEPVAYVSDRLPAMGELRAAPTRPLDKFESVGLTAMRHGEDLFISRDGERLRMLGGIASARQCVACHGGERGDLLGAFSYTLQREGD